MKPRIEWFGSADAERIPWPDTEDGRYARRYLMPMLRHSTSAYYGNARTELLVLLIDGEIVLPVTVSDTEYDNSYICSPYTHYASYAHEELRLIGSRFARRTLGLLIDGISLLMRASRVNRVVHVNNWLVSTNLYPRMADGYAAAVTRFLAERYPSHAIVWRSLNRTLTSGLLAELGDAGCRFVPSRQIYLLHGGRQADSKGTPAGRGSDVSGSGSGSPVSASGSKARWLLKRDAGLLQRNGYEVVGPDRLEESDMPRILELYNLLYLHKYSPYNPQFLLSYIRLAWRERLLELHVLRKDGRIDAALGYFRRDGVMTTPLFGYDTRLPQELGLYRMLSAVLLEHARHSGSLLHESSGAAQFKRNRGAVAEIEYSAVCDRHLPLRRRMIWAALDRVLNGVGVPLMQKLKL